MPAVIVYPNKIPTEPSGRLVYSREQLGELLGGVSLSSLVKMERLGQLTPITLTGRSSGAKYYAHDEVVALLKSLRAKAEKRQKVKKRPIKKAA